jgi:hypothetical protein
VSAELNGRPPRPRGVRRTRDWLSVCAGGVALAGWAAVLIFSLPVTRWAEAAAGVTTGALLVVLGLSDLYYGGY